MSRDDKQINLRKVTSQHNYWYMPGATALTTKQGGHVYVIIVSLQSSGVYYAINKETY
ncbi:unnamed protein product [Brugia pahangi]|uniref:Lipoprotein n=1 Tax=Brugia pahangi TaxID=6280 RepID=A0A0N4TF56_BRUPA|nr:unnamed protein product [Brugia pahangi]